MGVDTRLYPSGKNTPKSRAIKGTFVDFDLAKVQRTRVTLAQINAGLTILPALSGVKWRILDWRMISIGGAMAGATDVRILATQSAASVAIAAVAVAALTQSALVRAGAALAVILANGASFAINDSNTAVTVGKTGGTATTATHVDVFISYVAEAA